MRRLIQVMVTALFLGLGVLVVLADIRGWFSFERSFALIFPMLVILDYLFSPPGWRPQRLWQLFTDPIMPKADFFWWRDVPQRLAGRNPLGAILALGLAGLLVAAVVAMPADMAGVVGRWVLALLIASGAIRWIRWWREVA